MNNTNALSDNTFCFHDKVVDNTVIPSPLENSHFGIINFKAITSPETTDHLELLFVIDCSRSMIEKCSDGHTKMYHIINTLQNMIIFFSDKPNVNIIIDAFDSRMYSFVLRTNINKDNLHEILNKISKITPRRHTDIGMALTHSAEQIQTLSALYPEHIIHHIFMTDGEITCGITNIQTLKNLIITDININNAFVGFGIKHDAILLDEISSASNSAYYFIDKLNNSGLIYGEILHKIVYNILTDTELIIENGLVYDFNNNNWVERIIVGNIASESDKTFNIVSNTPSNCKVYIKTKYNKINVSYNSNFGENRDLTIHTYRQRTMQTLYHAYQLCKTKRTQQSHNTGLEEFEMFKTNCLLPLIEEIKTYIHDNNMQENKFLKNLCDDIYVCYKSIGTQCDYMFCKARQNSQGNQRLYSASNVDTDISDVIYNYDLSMFSQPSSQSLSGYVDDLSGSWSYPLEHHQVSSSIDDAPYLTPQATQLMRFISSGTTDYDGNDITINTQHIH